MNLHATQPVVTAGLGRRIGSMCYEALLLAAILLISGWCLLFVCSGLDLNLQRPLFQLHLIVVTAAYFVYCWTHGGQTLPMKTWRIRLANRYGTAISFQTGLFRYVLALLGLGLCGVGLLWALIDADRQFLHDRLAGTQILKCTA